MNQSLKQKKKNKNITMSDFSLFFSVFWGVRVHIRSIPMVFGTPADGPEP